MAARVTFFVGYFLASYIFIMLMVYAADII